MIRSKNTGKDAAQALPLASCGDPLAESPPALLFAMAICQAGMDALPAGMPLPNGLDRPPSDDR